MGSTGRCQACPAGKFKPPHDQLAVQAGQYLGCLECDRGQYQPAPGSGACIMCPSGKFQPSGWDRGQKRACAVCPAGKYSSKAGERRCWWNGQDEKLGAQQSAAAETQRKQAQALAHRKEAQRLELSSQCRYAAISGWSVILSVVLIQLLQVRVSFCP